MKGIVSWSDVEDFVDLVAARFNGSSISGVYGLPRGGLVFAVMLSHRMNIPMLAAPDANCIIIDDICDSGESLVHYYKNTSGGDVKDRPILCTMFYKENALGVEPDFWVHRKEDSWIVFPWENQ